MSLINDMLKDLDQRKYQPAGASGTTPRGLGQDNINFGSPLSERFRSVRNTGVIVTVVLVGFALSSTARLQQAQAPTQTLLDSGAIPTSQLPAISENTTVDTDLAANENKAHNTTIPDSSSTQNDNPPPQVAKVKETALKPPVSTSSRETNNSAYIEVTHRPLSEKQQLLSEFHVAATIYKEGNLTEAERLLEDLLARDNGQHQARLLLARLYAQQKLDSRAESVLTNGLRHYPQHAPYASLYAKILAAQGRDSEAIDALQNALPGARENADYHALLAGLYQRTANSAAAAESYRVALRLKPTHGEWWIGLAISSEQASDGDTAEKAYSQALQYPLASAVQQYAEQRLQQLSAKKTTIKSQNNK